MSKVGVSEDRLGFCLMDFVPKFWICLVASLRWKKWSLVFQFEEAIFGDTRVHQFGKADHSTTENFSGHLSLWIKAKVKARTPGPEISMNMRVKEKPLLLLRIDWLARSQLDLSGHTFSFASSHCICWHSGLSAFHYNPLLSGV